jgi:type I restriction enzyme S subunit
MSVATTVPSVRLPDIASVELFLPPLVEQRRIVAKIDALAARSKRARAYLDRVEALATRAKQAVLAAAFRGELTDDWRSANSDAQTVADLLASTPESDQSRGGREATTDITPGLAAISVNDPRTPLPEGWAWVGLRRIARQEAGHTPSRSYPEYWDGGVPWIGIRDAGAHHGRTITETIQTISNKGLENSSARLLPAGTVCPRGRLRSAT